MIYIFTFHVSGNKVILEHFLLEDASSEPYLHRDPIRLERFDVDSETNFTWCEFMRPIGAEDVYELDFTEKMHHFYLWGAINNDSRPVLPANERIKKSYMRYNVSQVYNEVDFDGGFFGRGGQEEYSQLQRLENFKEAFWPLFFYSLEQN
jgi:hypothetical protein